VRGTAATITDTNAVFYSADLSVEVKTTRERTIPVSDKRKTELTAE
jgi:hypothetical protein